LQNDLSFRMNSLNSRVRKIYATKRPPRASLHITERLFNLSYLMYVPVLFAFFRATP
jgi:hypothetical protein